MDFPELFSSSSITTRPTQVHHRCTSMQQSHCTLTNILQFDYIVDELTNFINNSYLFQDIFLGMDPYTNNELTHLSSVCTCFTDVAYWQA